MSNPDLKWEETSQTNVGLDMTLLKGVSFTFDYYHKKTTGMLLGIDVPGYGGNQGPIGNIADMVNSGYEFELGWDKQIGNLEFSLSGNASYLKNEVTFLGNDKEFIPGQRFGPSGEEITRIAVGRPVGFHYGYKTAGIFQTAEEVQAYVNSEGAMLQPNAMPGDFRFVDTDGDGILNDSDRTMIGDPTPDWSYGLNASASWKGFDLTIFGQGVQGNDVFKANRRYDLQNANWSTEALGRWTGEGSTNTFQKRVPRCL